MTDPLLAGKPVPLGVPVRRFTADTAEKTGQSARAILLKTERGEKAIDEVLNLIRGTKLDTGIYLAEGPSPQRAGHRRET